MRRASGVRVALLVVGIVTLTLPMLAPHAASRSGTIRGNEIVRWKGGPLNGSALDSNTCPGQGSCEDFNLEVKIPKRAGQRAVIDVSLASRTQLTLTLLAPSDGLFSAGPFTQYGRPVRPLGTALFEKSYENGHGRIADPIGGVWRIRAQCRTACSNTTYSGLAVARWVDVPDDGGGGKAIAHHADGRAINIDGRRTMHLFHTHQSAGEPTFAIDKAGHLFIDTTTPSRSVDGGRTWQPAAADVNPYLSIDPYVYLDRTTNRLFEAINAPGCSQLDSSDDLGLTWRHLPAACDVLQADHETIYAGPPVTSPTVGYPNIVYWCAIGTGATNSLGTTTLCAKSLDGGVSWVLTGAPPYADGDTEKPGFNGVPGHCSGATGHLFVDRAGVMYLPRGWCGQPWLAISRDEGLTWERVQVAGNGMNADTEGNPDHEAGVAVDAAGTIYFTWIGKNRLPYLAVSRNHGRSFGRPLMIGVPGLKESVLPSIDAAKAGHILIGYMGSSDSPGAPWTGDYSETNFHGYMTESFDAHTADPTFYSASVADRDLPLVRGACGPVRCQQVLDFIQVLFGPDGTGWGAFVDTCPDWCFRESPYPQGPEAIVAHLS